MMTAETWVIRKRVEDGFLYFCPLSGQWGKVPSADCVVSRSTAELKVDRNPGLGIEAVPLIHHEPGVYRGV